MRTDEPQPVRLAEYTPPDHFVDEISLDFALWCAVGISYWVQKGVRHFMAERRKLLRSRLTVGHDHDALRFRIVPTEDAAWIALLPSTQLHAADRITVNAQCNLLEGLHASVECLVGSDVGELNFRESVAVRLVDSKHRHEAKTNEP